MFETAKKIWPEGQHIMGKMVVARVSTRALRRSRVSWTRKMRQLAKV
jgi:hypothetical protein